MDNSHGQFKCSPCAKAFWDKEDLKLHDKNEHVIISIKCKLCDFTSETLANLGLHKKEKHCFKCEQCNWTAENKNEIEKHVEQVHGNVLTESTEVLDKIVEDNANDGQTNSNRNGNEERLERENLKLKKESKYWKNRFDQVLEDRNDLENMKRKFEEELSEAREDYRKEKAEREHLRVRNSLLQDMSKIIVDKCMKPSNDPKKKKDEEEINIVDEDLGEDIVRNKSKGYRRVSPANNA